MGARKIWIEGRKFGDFCWWGGSESRQKKYRYYRKEKQDEEDIKKKKRQWKILKEKKGEWNRETYELPRIPSKLRLLMDLN